MTTRPVPFALRPVAFCVMAACWELAAANPTGPSVAAGAASFQNAAKTLTVTNTPGTIINWQGFSIGSGETTRFIQQSAASAVLNRVVGQDMSSLLGTLSSNGRVFLVNPHGIVVGAGARIETAGFIASTLNITDSDFLQGRLRFEGGGGPLRNAGTIQASGDIMLVGPQIENSGIIRSDNGAVLLAAGRKLTITSPDAQGVRFELQAPTDSALNVGTLDARTAAMMFAGTLRHSGDIRVGTATDGAGHVTLVAQKDATVDSGTISATGPKGGRIVVTGGDVALESARFDASGEHGGGEILVGGDWQGRNPDVANAARTSVDAGTTLRADALTTGDGGKIVVWADRETRFDGALSARGGALGGNGGNAEVSGKEHLVFRGHADLGAARGALGNLLLDPLDLFVASGGGTLAGLVDELGDIPSGSVTISPETLAAIPGNVTLLAGRYMRVVDPIVLTRPGQSLAATVETFTPATGAPSSMPNRFELAAGITTAGGAVSLQAPSMQGFNSAGISTNGSGAAGGAISLTSAGAITGIGALNAGNAALQMSASNGAVQAGAINAGAVTVNAAVGPVATGAINAAAVTLSSGASSVSTGGIDVGAGTVDIIAGAAITAGTISTSNRANLTANGSAASITAKVNNGGAVTASATSIGAGSAVIAITSDTDLNVSNATANANTCPTSLACTAAGVNITAAGAVNIGTIAASAQTSAADNLSEAVSISAGGGIRALAGGGQVTAADVTLVTTPLSGGGIGTATQPITANVERSLTLVPNGNFRVDVAGPSINRFTLQPGALPGGSYSGTVQRAAGGLNVGVTANDTTVTIDSATFAGFDQRIHNSNPAITLGVPNGALNLTSITVPQGDTASPMPPATSAPLPVTIIAGGSVNIGSYTRESSPGSQPKATTIQSTSGSVTLGSVNASRDDVLVSAATGVSISPSGVTTQGGVSVNTTSGAITAGRIASGGTVTLVTGAGNVDVGQIDVSSGAGSVAITAVGGAVRAINNGPALEILTASAVSIDADTIGRAGFTNPLDVAGQIVTFVSRGEGGLIGFDTAPVVAVTPDLTILATAPSNFDTTAGARFNVTTGPIALKNLTVIANPAITGGGTSHVQSEARVYDFQHAGATLGFEPGATPVTQFSGGGLLSVTAPRGNIAVANPVSLGSGKLALHATTGSIEAASASFNGAGFTFIAGDGGSGPAVAVRTGAIGAIVAPAELTMQAGNSGARSGTVETSGSVGAQQVSIHTFNGAIRIGELGTDNVGNEPGGAVDLSALANANGGGGTIRTGPITGTTISIVDLAQPIITGALNGSTSVNIVSRSSVTTGPIDSPSVSIANDFFLQPSPSIQVGPIGSAVQAHSVLLAGSSVNVGGGITGDAGATITVVGTQGGVVGVAGPIVTGDGGAVAIQARDFEFTRIDAGAGTSSVAIAASNGPIRQTMEGGLNGIRARAISLSSDGPAGSITNTAAAGSEVDLFGVSALTVSTPGSAIFDAHSSSLSALNVTKGNVTTAPFVIIGLTDQSIAMSSGAPNATLSVSSMPALDFTMTYRGGGLTAGVISTSGGAATLSSFGDFAVSGGIFTGGLTGAGAVAISAPNVNTGIISTVPSGLGSGGAITVQATGTITVDGGVTAGPGGTITLDSGGAISGMVSSSLSSPVAVSAMTANGDIGSAGVPLAIQAPRVTLAARGSGRAFASLTGTNALDLRGDDGFNVASSVAFDTLAVASSAAGAGPLTLTAGGGQSYSFTRTGTDAFGAAIPGSFQVITADMGGGSTSGAFRAVGSDLFVGGAANLNVGDLTLGVLGTGDVRLQGTGVAPLALSNTNQNISNVRDVLITGNVNLTAGANQTILSGRNTAVQARDGSVSLSAATQTIAANTGNLSFTGGAGAGESVTLSASARQLLQTQQATGGSIVLQGGTGNNATVTASFDGAAQPLGALDAEQQIEARGQVRLLGGPGGSAGAAVTVSSNQRQLVRAGGAGAVAGESAVQLTAGAGSGASVSVTATGSAAQTIGESRCVVGPACIPLSYQTPTVALVGGGPGSFVLLQGAGGQNVLPTGQLTVRGGAGAGAFALVSNTSTATGQLIGFAGVLPNDITDVAILQGGSGAGSSARISSASGQVLRALGSITLTGGSAVDAFARVDAAAAQTVGFGTLTLTAGGAAGSFTSIDTTGAQALNGGAVTLTAGGTLATPAANAGAVIQGQSQTVFSGALTLTGGAGTAASRADAALRNLSGGQSISTAGTIVVNGGEQHSYTGIENTGAGTQTVTAPGGIRVTGRASGVNATAAIDNDASTAQTLTATGGGITIDNTGTGAARILSLGGQNTVSQFIDVHTSAGSSGSSSLTAGADQWLRTTNGSVGPAGGRSLRTAALGTGTASIDTTASQLLEVDYATLFSTGSTAPGSLIVGDVNAAGISRIRGGSQQVFGGSIVVQGGSGLGASSTLSATSSQVLSALRAGVDILGGSGVGATATLDPATRTLVALGNVRVLGGSGAGAKAELPSESQVIEVTRGDLVVGAGAGAGATAAVQSTNGPLTLDVARNVTVTAGGSLQASGALAASGGNDIVEESGAAIASNGGAVTVRAGRSVSIGGGVSSAGGAIAVTANDPTTIGVANREAGAASLAMAAGSTVNAGAGDVTLTLAAGGASGDVTLASVTGRNVAVVNSGPTSGSDILAAPGMQLTSTGTVTLLADALGAGIASPLVIAPGGAVSATATDNGIALRDTGVNPLRTSRYTTLAAPAGKLVSLEHSAASGSVIVDSNVNVGTAALRLNAVGGAAPTISFQSASVVTAAALALDTSTAFESGAGAAVALNAPVTANAPVRFSSGIVDLNAAGNTFNQPVTVDGASLGIDTTTTIAGGAGTRLVFSAGTIRGGGTFGVDGNIAWTGGTLARPLTVGAGRVMDISGTATKTLDGTDAVLFNAGTLNMSGAGNLVLSGGAALTNAGMASWSGPGSIAIGAGSTVTNSGTFNASAPASGSVTTGAGKFVNNLTLNAGGPAVLTFASAFDNSSTANVDGGTLRLAGGGTDSGSFAVATGSTLETAGGDRTISGPISGAGNLAISGGALDATGAVTLTGALTVSAGKATFGTSSTPLVPSAVTVSGGTVTFNRALSDSGAFALSGGSAVFGAAASVAGPAAISGGSTGGSAPLTIDNTLALSGSIEGGINVNGTTTIAAGSPTIAAGATLETDTLVMSGGTLVLNGTLNLSGAAANTATGGTVNNTGTLRVSGSGALAFSDTAALNNSGTLAAESADIVYGGAAQSFGNGTRFVGPRENRVAANSTFNGAIDGGGSLVLAGGSFGGTATLSGATAWRGGTATGAMTVAPSSSLTVSGGGSTASSTGSSLVNNGTVSFDGSHTASGVFSNAGTVNVRAGTLTLAGGGADSDAYALSSGTVLALTGGTRDLNGKFGVTGTGILRVAGATVNVNTPLTQASGSPALEVAGGTVNNVSGIALNGAFTWSGGTITGAGVLTTGTSASTTIDGVATLAGTSWNNFGPVALTGDGRLVLAGSPTTPATIFDNRSSGVITDNSAAATPIGFAATRGSTRFDNSGRFIKAAGSAATQTLDVPMTNAQPALIAVQTGTLVANGLDKSAGVIDIAAGATFSTAGRDFENEASGIVRGNGTFLTADFKNDGIVAPGASPGVLTIDGNLTQQSDGRVDIELAGPRQGIDYDLLKVTGDAALDGALNINVVPTATIAVGDTFQVITYARVTGDFAVKTSPPDMPFTATPGPTSYQVVRGSQGNTTPPPFQLPPELTNDPARNRDPQGQRDLSNPRDPLAAKDDDRRKVIPECR